MIGTKTAGFPGDGGILPAAIGQAERERIAAALRAGGKRNEVAREFERSPSVISKIAVDGGIEFDRSQVKKAAKATREYAEAERLILSDELFEKLRGMAESTLDSGDFRDLVVSFGILTDKRRLETGEATSRHESVDPERRARMKESLDEVAAQRRKSVG